MVELAVIIYFSQSGQNKQNGHLQYINIGNTAILAKKISQQIDAQKIELQVVDEYDTGYQATLIRSKKEIEANQKVQINSIDYNIKTENQIFLGFPIWWGSIPPAVSSFLISNDLSDTDIYPFCTHEGSQFGRSIAEIKTLIPNAQVKSGLAVRGSKVYRADQAIINWLKYLDFKVTIKD